MRECDRTVTFGGDVIPAKMASTPSLVRPTRKMTVTKIAGTNREYVDMEDAWETYDQTYSFYLGDGSEDCVQPSVDEVARVIYKTGWQILTDDYEPDYYRLAYYQGGFETDDRYSRLGVFSLTFRCRPERFLVTGNTSIPVDSGESITNPTAFNAKPLIHITGSGDATLTVNGTTMAFTGITDYLNIDCDKMDVYRLPAENKNSLMTGNFPVLKSGDNLVSFTGGITSVTITPKWWTI